MSFDNSASIGSRRIILGATSEKISDASFAASSLTADTICGRFFLNGGLHSGLGLRQLNEGKFKNALTLLEN